MPRLRVRRLPVGTYQLLLNLTNRHIHAQLVDREAGRVMVAVHSNQGEVRQAILGPDDHPRSYKTSTVAAAETVGTIFGQRAKAQGIESVTWVRPGRYHGKIKAFIDSVRASGIRTLQAHPRLSPTKPATNN